MWTGMHQLRKHTKMAGPGWTCCYPKCTILMCKLCGAYSLRTACCLFYLMLIDLSALDFSPTLSPGFVKLHTRQFGTPLNKSTMTSDEYKNAVMQAKEHIMAGDIFQIVLSQRFERRTYANPFEVYRALRIVNPSPYMAYVQVEMEPWSTYNLDTVLCTGFFLRDSNQHPLVVCLGKRLCPSCI